MDCHRIDIPAGVRVRGVTADGLPTLVLPGEYLVHRLPLKLPSARTLLRFVGADAMGRDAHVPLESVRAFLAGSPLAEHHEETMDA